MPAHTSVNPEGTVAPIGPYSNGIVAAPGRLMAIAGQGGLTPDGKLVGPGAREQTEQIFENFKVILAAAGGSLSDIIQMTIYTRAAENYPEVNAARKAYFSAPYPASATVTDIGFLGPGMLVEISALAVIP
jgi:2-iminobutanoate/2-iminopropanoate deaminase